MTERVKNLGYTSARGRQQAEIGKCRVPSLENPPRVGLGSPAHLLTRSSSPPASICSLFSAAGFSLGYNFVFAQSNARFISPPSYQGTPETMPVQTQSRNQPVSTSDPFDDPNAIRLVPSLPPKASSKRDAGMDTQRDATNTRSQDPRRAKPNRSQTQQDVRSVALCALLA